MTAVEWLVEQIDNKDMGEIPMWIYGFIEQAKELEKHHIVSAFEIGYENGACTNENESIYHGGNYYNLTFKSE